MVGPQQPKPTFDSKSPENASAAMVWKRKTARTKPKKRAFSVRRVKLLRLNQGRRNPAHTHTHIEA